MPNAKDSFEKQAHWDKVYKEQDINELGWTQQEASASLQLIEACNLQVDDTIVDVGSGASVLIQNLVEKGFLNIIATDISENALSANKKRLGDLSGKVNWIVDDVTNPHKLPDFGKAAVWHDRAAFHLLTDFKERLNYFSLMNQLVKEEGYVILSAFNNDAEDTCSNLEVRKYDEEGLRSFMGPGYKLLQSFNTKERSPNGTENSFIYALFQRIPHVEM